MPHYVNNRFDLTKRIKISLVGGRGVLFKRTGGGIYSPIQCTKIQFLQSLYHVITYMLQCIIIILLGDVVS